MKVLFTILALLVMINPAMAWNYSKHSIKTDEIISGGPPKDGIPALISPKYVPASKATYMKPKEKVIGVVIKGEAKAYPIRVMSWHELVNDQIGGVPVLVSW